MEALRTLMAGHLPPAGEPVLWASAREQADLPDFSHYHTTWVDSGTSALALALQSARLRRPELKDPQVIVPGYCCPDLVAAANYAGVEVVVADIRADDPAYDPETLETLLCEQTLAIIAVNFLGITEDWSGLSKLLRKHPHVALIEDNAQWFPDTKELNRLNGDYVVFSFGRGKPVSLLGGGLLLHKDELGQELPAIAEPGLRARALTRCKYLAYNALLHPQLYQLLSRNPLIRLGETRYHPLDAIEPLDSQRAQILPRNMERYRAQARTTESVFDALLEPRNQLKALYTARRHWLLRYPVLMPSERLRDELLSRLNRAGLGATAMYQRPLAQIPGLDGMLTLPRPCSNAACPNAERFAARLLTLPVHSGVKGPHRDRIAAIVDELLPAS